MADHVNFIPLPGYREYSPAEMAERAKDFYQEMHRRRSVRDFSDRPVDREVIEWCLRTAGTAPSGANLQPWHFAAISSPEVKHRIRIAAEAEEREFYEHRAPDEWLNAVAPMGTDANKPFLDHAPWLIAIFAKPWEPRDDGSKAKNYYAAESVGIATGFLLTALHHAGLATLTHTPSPMKFLNGILNRPVHERPFLLLVVGYPAEHATVPNLSKKDLNEISTFY